MNYPIQSSGRLRVDPLTGDVSIGEHIDFYGDKYKLSLANHTEWARVDKDNNLVHLDMDLCAKGPADAYAALAVGIWNAAIEEAARYAAGEGNDTLADSIRELKK
jgi:hypothetical protein